MYGTITFTRADIYIDDIGSDNQTVGHDGSQDTTVDLGQKGRGRFNIYPALGFIKVVHLDMRSRKRLHD